MLPSTTPADLPTPRGLGLGANARTRLITTAGALFASHGLPNVTLELIAQEAKVDLETVTAEFPSVGSALAATLSYLNSGLRDAGQDASRPRGWASLEGLIRGMVQGTATPGFIRLYHDAQIAAAAKDHPAHDWLLDQQGEVRAVIEDTIKTGIEDGEVRTDADADAIHRLLAATLVGLYPVDLLFSDEVPLESTMDVLLECLKSRYATPEYLARG